jgi:hypothetical protein
VPPRSTSTSEQRVAALVHARQPQLAALVRQAIDRELDRLVEAEIERLASRRAAA